MSTRRAELIIEEARSLSYSENYSLTEGWNQNVAVSLINLALDKLYLAITEIDNPANITEYTQDVISGQQSYVIPIEVQMYIRIMDVRFQWGGQTYEFVTLAQGMIQDRLDYPINIPSTYCIRDGRVLLSPAPNITKASSLIINFQKRMRSLDVRRGRVVGRQTVSPKLELTFLPQSEKDATMRENGESVLDKIDFCCVVDVNGIPVVSAFPVLGYDFDLEEIIALPSYTFPAAELAALDVALAAGKQLYVTQGEYSSTHSELDTQCESFLIEYVVKRFLRLQSNTSETLQAMQEEESKITALINAYRRYRPTQYPIRWVQNARQTSFPFGTRGVW